MSYFFAKYHNQTIIIMKKIEDIKTIGIIGAGTMGLGIAQICAQAGYKTILFDTNPEAVSKALSTIDGNLSKAISIGKLTPEAKSTSQALLSTSSDINEVIADLIIEAVVERLEVKHQIFNDLAKINEPDTIFATNTSSIPITKIAFGIPHPERVVGMHFFNPAHLMKLVEVISGASTDDEVVETTKSLAERLGKTAVICKDSAGFIVNRVARHYYVESLKILEENVAPLEVIDELLEANGFKLGPFKLMDLIGVDTNFSVTSSMYNEFHQDPKFRPSRIQKQKVDAGHWGRKSGRGFYEY
jgi:3-hydroxybutyryl-CoA dehydrogenase